MRGRLTAWLGVAGVVTLVAVAVAFGLFRSFANAVPGYRSYVEARVEALVGQPVRIEHLDARWRYLGPELRLLDVVVGEGRAARLRVDELHIGLDLWASLMRREVVPSGITLLGTDVHVQHFADGTWVIGGMALDPQRAVPAERSAWATAAALLSQVGHLTLANSTVLLEWHGAPQPRQRFTDVYIDVRSTGQRHRIALRTAQAGTLGQDITLALRARGPLNHPGRWSAELEARGQGLRPGPYLQDLVGDRLDATGANLNMTLDLRWSAGALRRLASEAQLRDLRLPAQEGFGPSRIEELSGRYVLTPAGDGWALSMRDLVVAMDGNRWSSDSLSLEIGDLSTPGAQRIDLVADHLRLADTVRLAAALPPALRRGWPAIVEAQPKGSLSHLAIHYRPQSGDAPVLQADFEFSDLGWRRAPDGWPVATGLNGRVHMEGRDGVVSLDSRNVSLYLPKLFATAWPVERLTALVRWRASEDGLRLEAEQVSLANSDLALEGRMAMHMPVDAAPTVDLAAKLDRARIEAIARYLPRVGLPSPARQWLVDALRGGRIGKGSVKLSGPVDRFPFREGGGEFVFRVSVEDTVLAFHPRWPRLEGVAAEVLWQGPSLTVQAEAGTTLGAEIVAARAHIADLAEPELSVQGEARTDAERGLRYLRQSPLADDMGDFLAGLSAAGSMRVALSLYLPIRRMESARVDGKVTLADVSLTLPGVPFEAQDISGDVTFTRERIEAEALRGRLDGYPLSVTAEPVMAAPVLGGMRPVRIRATGRVSGAEVERRLGLFSEGTLHGVSGWQAVVDIGAGARVDWQVSSSLAGMAVHLPEPLGKDSAQSKALTVANADGEARRLRIDYGDSVRALLRLESAESGWRLERGDLQLSGGAPLLPTQAGLAIHGRLPRLSAGWLSAGLGGHDGSGQTMIVPHWLGALDLHIGQLEGLGLPLSDVELQAARDRAGGSYRLQVDSDALEGEIVLPAGDIQSPWKITLRALHLPARFGGDPSGGAKTVEPPSLPAMQVLIEDLRYGETWLGALEFAVTDDTDGLSIQGVRLSLPGLTMTGEGRWLGRSGAVSSEVRWHLQADDPVQAARYLGYPTVIEARSASASGELRWPASPWAFVAGEAAGELSVRIKDGYLYVGETDPGAGPAVLLFSLYALPRRLSMDFGDVFRQTMAFDLIVGRFRLADGLARIETLNLDGPAADIEVEGQTDLAARRFDQTIEVVPSLAVGAALAGTVAGGPLVGAAVLLGQQLLRGPLSRLAEIEYRLTGSWDDPRLERIEGPFNLPALGHRAED